MWAEVSMRNTSTFHSSILCLKYNILNFNDNYLNLLETFWEESEVEDGAVAQALGFGICSRPDLRGNFSSSFLLVEGGES